MGIYDVDIANGDLYSPQQRQHARDHKGNRGIVHPTRVRAKDRKFDQPRGTGPTGKTTLRMTEAEKQTVCLMSGQGATPADIALKLGRSIVTIQRTIATAQAEARRVGIDWKSIMKDKAVLAVNDALDHREDLYKRGGLGIQALKGLGELEADQSMNLTAILSSVPPDMRDRYLSTDDAIEAKVKEIADAVPVEIREDDRLHGA